MTYDYFNYLAHHGIKGQKWGVRRFQNEDGSLTSDGQKRYRGDIKNVSKRELKRQVSDYLSGKNHKEFDAEVNRIGHEIEADRKVVAEYNKLANKSTKQYLSDSEEATLRDLEAKVFNAKKGEPNAFTRVWQYDNNDKGIGTIYGKRLSSAVLKDLGYDDTDDAREWLQKTAVNWDRLSSSDFVKKKKTTK